MSHPPTAQTLWGLFGAAAGLLFLYSIANVLLVIFAGVLLALALRAGGRGVARITPLPLTAATPVFMVLLLLVIVGLGMLLAPHAAEGIARAAEAFPRKLASVERDLRTTDAGRAALDVVASARDRVTNDQGLPTALGGVRGMVGTTTSALIGALVVLFLGILLALQPRLYSGGVLQLLPVKWREGAHHLMRKITAKLRGWILAKLISMLIVGVATTIGLLILGVPLAFTLGFLTALLTFVPNVGPTVAAIPPLLVAFSVGPFHALGVMALYLGVQIVESYVLTPMVLRQTIRLPPALTITAQVIMGFLYGVLGILLAAPLLAVLMAAVSEIQEDGDAWNKDQDDDAAGDDIEDDRG